MPDLTTSTESNVPRRGSFGEREACKVPDVPEGPMFGADTVGPPTVLASVQDDRRLFGDTLKPAPLFARLAFEGRGLHDSDTPAKPSRGNP